MSWYPVLFFGELLGRVRCRYSVSLDKTPVVSENLSGYGAKENSVIVFGSAGILNNF